MNLYIVTRPDYGWDQCNSFAVVAESEQAARDIHPHGEWQEKIMAVWVPFEERHNLNVKLIGKIDAPSGVVRACINDG